MHYPRPNHTQIHALTVSPNQTYNHPSLPFPSLPFPSLPFLRVSLHCSPPPYHHTHPHLCLHPNATAVPRPRWSALRCRTPPRASRCPPPLPHARTATRQATRNTTVASATAALTARAAQAARSTAAAAAAAVATRALLHPTAAAADTAARLQQQQHQQQHRKRKAGRRLISFGAKRRRRLRAAAASPTPPFTRAHSHRRLLRATQRMTLRRWRAG